MHDDSDTHPLCTARPSPNCPRRAEHLVWTLLGLLTLLDIALGIALLAAHP